MNKSKKCRCRIRAIVQMWKMTPSGMGVMVHPDDYEKTLRKFIFCPLCGNRFQK